MNISSSNEHVRPRYTIPLFIFLLAAGLAGNYFKFYILNLHFIFGSIFAMLAMQFFGLGRGVLAAAIISSYTYLTWNHPYAVITMTSEVAAVGLLIRWRKINLVMADTFYWLFMGIPVGFICFYYISHLTANDAMFLMTKQTVNGIANALIARFIFIGYSLRLKSFRISFREILSNIMAFFVVVSMLVITFFDSKIDFTETDRGIRESLIHESKHITDHLENFVGTGLVRETIDTHQIKSIFLIGFARESGVLYSLLDKNGYVILTNKKDQKVMSPFSRGKGTLKRHEGGVLQWIPDLPFHVSTIELWGRSHYVVESDIGKPAKLKLILERPIAPFQQKLYKIYIDKLKLIFLILLTSLLIAELISRRIARSNEHLVRLTHDLSARLESGETIGWPDSGIQDNQYLIDNFREMAESLKARFEEIRQINETLEQEVEKRAGELQVSEARLRAIFEAARGVSFIITDTQDPEPLVMEFSPGAENIFGYKRDEIIGKPVSILHIPEVVAQFPESFMQMRKGNDGLSGEIELVRKSGERFPALFTSYPLVDDSGQMYAVLGVSIDISDQKKLEEKLRQAHKMEAIGTLAGGIAHDFNNILTSVLGFSELALDDAEEGTLLEKNLKEIQTAGKRARDLIKQILTFARETDEVIKPIQVDSIAKEALKLIRPTTPSTIKIIEQIDSSSLIMGNSSQLHQLFMNLCTNATQAIEDDKGVLEVALEDVQIDEDLILNEKTLKPGKYVKISVSDTGKGIKPEDVQFVFEPYFTTKGLGEGTGMGLATVYGIVDSFGGTITVESELGKGTIFSIYFPVTTESVENQLIEEDAFLSGTERILFVDDEMAIVTVNSKLLKRIGYSVSVCTSSLEALELFRAKPDDFDMVVTDMAMPEMTGEKLSKELMKIKPDIPIILCTGYSSKINEDSALKMGIKAFIFKPVVGADMAKTVRRVLDEAKSSKK